MVYIPRTDNYLSCIHSSCGPLISEGLHAVVDVNEELYAVDIDTNILYVFPHYNIFAF